MLGTVRFALLAAVTLLTACGGGGGGDGGFLPDRGPEPLEITTSTLPDVVSVPFATVLEASGGEGAYDWALVSDGGTSFTLDAEGVLRADEAIPQGTYGLTFAVTDADGRTTERSLTIAVAIQPLAISTTALPPAVDGTPYSSVLEAVGGNEPYTWTLIDNGGTGFTLTSAGVLSGDPPTRGTYGLTVTVTDDTGAEATRSLLLQVDGDEPQPLAVATTALPQANEGELYAAVLAATGGSGDYSWQLVNSGGSGLTLSDSGVLRGTAPDQGTYGLTFLVDDGENTVQRSLTLTVSADDSPLLVETTSLPDGVVGTRYAAVVTATGGSGQYSWTLLSAGGSGLSLSSNGVLSGTPGESGTFGVSVRVSDGEGATAVRSLIVRFIADSTAPDPVALAVTTTTLPNAEPGARYATVIVAEGGTGIYTWTLVRDGNTGLTLDANGVLTGTAPAPGNYGLTFQVNDGQATVSRSLTLSVVGDGPQALTITTEDLPEAIAGTRYATVINASGGTGDYAWAFASDGGTGLTLDASGVLSGIAPAGGNYGLTVTVDDGEETVTRSLTLQVTGAQQAPLTVTTNSLPGAQVGALYAATLTASGGIGNYSWTLVNGGGAGLTLDTNGALRGTPSAAGNFALTVEVTDGNNTARRTLTLVVAGDEVEPLVIATTALPNVDAGESFAAVLEATGGDESYTWEGLQVPSGLSLGEDGVFSGTAPSVGSYGVTVRVTDGAGRVAQRSYVLTVTGEGQQQLQITTGTLPDAVAGTSYAAVLSASGGDPAAYMWDLLDDGDSGLTLNLTSNSPDGFLRNVVLEGTAPAAGSYGITVQVSDGERSDVASFVLAVSATSDTLVEITTNSLPSASTNTDYVVVLEAQGGSESYTWSLINDGGLGSEITLDADGILSGTITTAGTYGLTFEVDDGNASAQKSLVLTVIEGGPQALTIITETVGAVSVEEPIFATVFEAEGGVRPYTWIIEEDTSNSGFTLTPNGGVLSGEPPAPGVYGLVISVTDADGTKVEKAFAVDVEGNVANPVTITTESIPAASTSEPYAVVLRATGTAPLQWDLLNADGSGLTAGIAPGDDLDPATGVLSFGPGDVPAGTYSLSVEVVDDNATADVVTLTLTVD